MSTHNIGFYEEMAKTIFQLISNIVKYALYLFISGTAVEAQSSLSISQALMSWTALKWFKIILSSNMTLLISPLNL